MVCDFAICSEQSNVHHHSGMVRKRQTRNLEILGFDASHRSGMTVVPLREPYRGSI
jgi:hypothetical protein